MLSIHDGHLRQVSSSGREWLRVGGLIALGLSLPSLLQMNHVSSAPVTTPSAFSGDLGASFGKAKNVIFLWLQGGPPQHETFDPKPEAPLEIRGPFKPISTNVPGIQFSELLPRTSRYGRYTWGQSVLLARRLIEAGVHLVHVNWARDPGDNAVDNPLWDTHALNADRLQDNLCPQFDPTFAALMDDLSERGLLDETLVVVIGEFGRTPKINANGGRDHWGHVFSFAMAGAGIRGGKVIGASDKNGAYPATTPITGGDLTATIFHLLGIDPSGVFHDKESRSHPLTKGEPIVAMFGDRSQLSLQTSEGDPSFVPPFDTRLLFDTDFRDNLPLIAVEPPSRAKGWRAWSQPGLTVAKSNGFTELMFAAGSSAEPLVIEQGSRAILAQEIRNARGGQYTFKVQASAVADSLEEFEKIIAHFRLRLVLFRFQNMQKDPRAIQELATADFRPVFGESHEFLLDRFLGSTSPGANFPIGCGLGVLIAMETIKLLTFLPDQSRRLAVRLQSVELTFNPRQRDESVTV